MGVLSKILFIACASLVAAAPAPKELSTTTGMPDEHSDVSTQTWSKDPMRFDEKVFGTHRGGRDMPMSIELEKLVSLL